MPEPVPSPVFDSYWKLAAERQQVLFRRLAGQAPPWTEDPIIRQHRFTNAYRAADRVSQFLIRNVIYNGDWSPDNLLFRILLFKLFNKIETWELLRSRFGEVDLSTFSVNQYGAVLSGARQANHSIYSAAYIMASAPFGSNVKHENHLRLLEYMLKSGIVQRVQRCITLGQLYGVLLSFQGIGRFLAYQFAIDINYSTLTNFDENSFVVPGPGARDGIAKCFVSTGGMSEAKIIEWTTERQVHECARLGLNFLQLGTRRLTLIDCQNLYCETDKYARVAHPEVAGLSGRTKIKQWFRARPDPVTLWFPPKWNINSFFGWKP